MFAAAYKLASGFTKPVIISTRHFDGTIQCGLGAFVVLNPEGWIATVAHLWDSYWAHKDHQVPLNNYRTRVKEIEEDGLLSPKQKRKKIAKLSPNPGWVTNHSFWWDGDGVSLKDIKPLPDADLVVGRLEPFDPKRVTNYPTLKNPSINLDPGTSLCRLGYPFYDIHASFDETKNAFELPSGTFPIPRFPIEGIYTRNLLHGKAKDGNYEIKFLETSSPGLRGQSGGPVFDTKGTLWGLQSRTSHLPLGFSPKVKKNGREVEENQFLNVGVAVHPDLIVSFLRTHNIQFSLSNY